MQWFSSYKRRNVLLFYRKERKTEQKKKKKLQIWEKIEKNLRNDQREIWLFSKKRKTESGTTEKSQPIRALES